MSSRGSLSINPTLEQNAVFRAAWRLMLETPSGRKTVDLLAADGFKTVIVPGTQAGAIAIAFNRFRMGKTKTTSANSTNTCTIEMGLLNAAMLSKLDGTLPILAPHTMTSLLAAVIHHELRHAVGRSNSAIDQRLDHHQNNGKSAETVWRSRDPEHQQFLNELKLLMPQWRDTSRMNQGRRRHYDEILLKAHDPAGPRQLLLTPP